MLLNNLTAMNPNISPNYSLQTAASRPNLFLSVLKDENHPLNTCWPEFLSHDQSQSQFADAIPSYAGLRKFQFAITEQDKIGDEHVIAIGRSIPFYWPQLDSVSTVRIAKWFGEGDEMCEKVMKSLPDGGWDTIASRGVRQYRFRNGIQEPMPNPHFVLTEDQKRDVEICMIASKPNALSALSVTVRPDRRGAGLAEALIEQMKKVAKEEGLKVLLAPLRPTKKTDFPCIDMECYISWTIGGPDPLPFDPWLRKHVRVGGKVVKVASQSQRVEGSVQDWAAWTGINIQWALREMDKARMKRGDDGRLYGELTIEGGLVPLKVYADGGKCTYVEPNVWVCHEVK